MYTVVNELHLDIPVRDLQPALEDEAAPLLAGYPGFHALHVAQLDVQRALIILLWENAVDALNGARAFGAGWFRERLAPHLASQQQRSAGEVVVSWERVAPVGNGFAAGDGPRAKG